MIRERDLEKIFRQEINGLGGLLVKLDAATNAGVPDRLVLLPEGRSLLVELKTETGSLRPVQILWHERARKIGHEVQVLYGVDGIRKFIKENHG